MPNIYVDNIVVGEGDGFVDVVVWLDQPVDAQQTAAASEKRLKRTKRRALSGSGCRGEGKRGV